MDWLDPAVLRRFDLEIQFDYLKPEQAGKLFIRVLVILQGYTRPRRYAESVKKRLLQLRTLTPGDFATVVRQARGGEDYDSDRLMAVLGKECCAKQHGMESVTGFVS